MSQKPSVPQGTRDFSPVEMARRRYIFSTLEAVFKQYGFKQLETPSLENLSTLTGKYGDEGDKLLFKVLNSGDYLQKAPDELVQAKDSKELIKHIADRGLRYDLTVPFARYVVMHQHEISFPFKRYQIQPVWRADRPQKGRYREFYQCDADIVGSDSLLYEAELSCIYDEAFHRLGIPVSIRINNRKVLESIAIRCGFGETFRDFTVIIDKLDKIGEEKVAEELTALGGDAQAAVALLASKTFNREALDGLAKELNNEVGEKGIAELEELLSYLETQNLHNEIILDTTLARGLNYYTGTIYEVVAKSVKMGSIGGGGRYDDLTGIFGLKGVSGVGISFGADRIYDVLLEMNAFPELGANFTQLIFCPMDEASRLYSFKLASQCREAGIQTEVYPEPAKLKKQLGYADNNGIPVAVIVGENERESGALSVKFLQDGQQESLDILALINRLK
ncbi:MAG: histidine--tRNA ligase [Bacteroidetes bacterium]|nr:MAG: histidine--tRNA ligase [Bacteroidota bacterium]